jgi:hypothetical protein
MLKSYGSFSKSSTVTGWLDSNKTFAAMPALAKPEGLTVG